MANTSKKSNSFAECDAVEGTYEMELNKSKLNRSVGVDDAVLSSMICNKENFNGNVDLDVDKPASTSRIRIRRLSGDLLSGNNGPAQTIMDQPTPKPLTPNASPSITPNPVNLNENSDNIPRIIQLEIDKAAEVVLRLTMSGAVESNELFRCAFTNCDWMKSDEREFLMHLSQHTCTEYICYHCKQSFAMPVELINHLKSIHLKHRFFCSDCDMTGATQQDLNSHFKIIHGIDDIQYRPLNPENYDSARDLFVVYPTGKSLKSFIASLTERADDMKESKKTYLPSEIDLLPKYQIFEEEIQCGLCSFRNKVRQNLVRHLTGCNGQQAPVNPVPRLNTGERHFDEMRKTFEMRNLAASSHSSNPNNIEHGLLKHVRGIPLEDVWSVSTEESNNCDGNSNSNSNNDRFMIVPPKEEVRSRPANLRQQPKRKDFSMYVTLPNDTQPSTSAAQPPISLRLKRINDPVSDEQASSPSNATTHKKANVTQDVWSVSTKESNNCDSDRFMIVPPKEEVRSRPANLRQQPKRKALPDV